MNIPTPLFEPGQSVFIMVNNQLVQKTIDRVNIVIGEKASTIIYSFKFVQGKETPPPNVAEDGIYTGKYDFIERLKVVEQAPTPAA